MTDMDRFQGQGRQEAEEWILGQIEREGGHLLPLDAILEVLAHFGSAGIDRRVDGWAEWVQELLLDQGDRIGALRVLELRCDWHAHDRAFKAVCNDIAGRAFSDRPGKTLLQNAGFDDSGLTAADAVRRLLLLARLEPGVLCRDKTWGFGVIRRVDDFYARVTIDFENKRGHEMALSYAAGTLELLPESHLMARVHHEPDAVRALADENPAALVRLALESYGPLTVDELKTHLEGRLVEAADWKGFWDRARKALKADPRVDLPSKRADSMRLLESPDAHREQAYVALAALREPAAILKKLEAMESAGLLESGHDAYRKTLADRLAFAAWGAEDHAPALMARALLTADRLSLVQEDGRLGDRRFDVSDAFRRLLTHPALIEILHALPVRMASAFLARVADLDADAMVPRLLDLLPRLSVPVLQEAMGLLREKAGPETIREALGQRLRQRTAGPALLYWLLRHPDAVEGIEGVDSADLLRQGLDALEWPDSGEMLKAQHQLRAFFESAPGLCERLETLSDEQRRVFLMALQAGRGWDEISRRGVMAILIKTWPELQSVLNAAAGTSAAKPRARMTSWRSYRERQEQFRKLMEVDIPENAREIAVARSYGDLRENAEFKYAKEHQRILYRRRDELEQDLEQVKGTDFENLPADVAGMGTEVDIRKADGTHARYCILGEWDRDEALNIISSLSALARQLEGHCTGDAVELPFGDGGRLERCTVMDVTSPGEAVLAWLRETPSPV